MDANISNIESESDFSNCDSDTDDSSDGWQTLDMTGNDEEDVNVSVSDSSETVTVSDGSMTERESEADSENETTNTTAMSSIEPSRPEEGGADADVSQRIGTFLQEVRELNEEQQTLQAGVREVDNNVLPAGNGEDQGGEIPG